MATITFDTHEFVKELRAAGFTEQQAEALTETVRATQGVGLAHLATRTDLLAVENRLIKWGVAIALGQAALIATLVKPLSFPVSGSHGTLRPALHPSGGTDRPE
jgi:hypothetical protein